MTSGQMFDMDAEKSMDLAALDRMHTQKTGALLRAALRIGAIVGEATKEQFEVLTFFGERLGLAFQIIDDVLDVTGTSEATGKTVQKDESQGKVTYPKLLGSEESKARAEKLLQEGKESLRVFGEKADVLLGLSDYVLTRNR